MQKITKAVMPAAGLGKRFLPATKACPKEMLPIVDKPTIQYIIEEVLASVYIIHCVRSFVLFARDNEVSCGRCAVGRGCRFAFWVERKKPHAERAAG